MSEIQTPSAKTAPKTPPDLLLVDGSSYLYRAYFAMPDLRSPEGAPTGAIFGIVNMLRRLAADYPSVHRACVFDAPGKTFRDDLYPEYKATRTSMPDELRVQIEPIHEVIKLMGWTVLMVPLIEADDVIGTLAKQAEAKGHTCLISSGDKDLTQLVSDHVTMVDTMGMKTYDRAGVKERFGVQPEQMIDYLTLVGDTVDNVPGVNKVGPKTAVKLLEEYGSVDAMLEQRDAIKGAVGEHFRKAVDWLPMGRKLLTVKIDCDLNGHLENWEMLAARPPENELLLPFFKRNGFKTWTRELEAKLSHTNDSNDLFAEDYFRKESSPAASISAEGHNTGASEKHFSGKANYETITTHEQLNAWIKKLNAASIAAFDTETTSLDEMVARIVGVSFSVEEGSAAYVPCEHVGPDVTEQLPLAEVLAALKPWLESAKHAKVAQHAKYDLHVLANHDIAAKGFDEDTMLQSYVLEAHKSHSLDSLAQRLLGRKGLSYEDVAGKGAAQIPFAQVAVDVATKYSSEDSDFTLSVYHEMHKLLAAEPALEKVYRDIEMPATHVLQRIERHGVLIDAGKLAHQSQQLAARMMELEKQAYEMAEQPFNLGSPKQIGEIFFDKLKMPVVKKTASGAPSTDEEVLEKLALDYPLPKVILEHRGLAKLKGTYTDKLPKMINLRTGRVHTHYAQAVAVTGRLSSNDPNLQNIPIRTAEGRRVREAFIAPPGSKIVSADYSQIELRIMAHISEDESLLRAFSEGLDVHKATASEVFSVALDQVSSEQRRYAKVINFGLIYGMSAFGLASNLGIERSAATAYIDKYFQRYPGVKRYMDETRASAKAKGYVETVFGRRLWLPEINSPNGPRRGGAERAAINAPMQGTAADLIKLSMIAVDKALYSQQRKTKMIMQVHDELVFEVPEAELDWVKQEVPKMMAGVANLKVPLLTEVGVGDDWDKAH
jgi:DNA polymerase I